MKASISMNPKGSKYTIRQILDIRSSMGPTDKPKDLILPKLTSNESPRRNPRNFHNNFENNNNAHHDPGNYDRRKNHNPQHKPSYSKRHIGWDEPSKMSEYEIEKNRRVTEQIEREKKQFLEQSRLNKQQAPTTTLPSEPKKQNNVDAFFGTIETTITTTTTISPPEGIVIEQKNKVISVVCSKHQYPTTTTKYSNAR